MPDKSRSPAVWFPAVRANSGADVFTERLCAGLNARGVRAEITWLPLRAEYAPWSVPVPKPPAWANIVHVNSWLPPRFLPRGLPVVSTLHSCMHAPAILPYKRPAQRMYHAAWIKRVEAANLRRAQRIVAVSHYAAQAAQAAFGLYPIDVIHNGVDIAQFRPLSRGAPHQPFRLLYVGNWTQLKGVDLLAPIMQALGSAFVLLYTTDRNGAHLRYPLPGNTQSLGRLDVAGLIAAYQQADALLFPSRLEGFGLVAVEAMACGLPVIATNASSLPEVIENGVSGLLCNVNDVCTFIEAARQLAQDPALWRAMRLAAMGVAQTRFNAVRQLDQWVNIYESLCRHNA